MKKIIKKFKESPVFALIAIIIISFLLRGYLLSDNLFFGPEQGRDFLVIKDLVANQKFTLIGPKTDIDGIFHGPLFYYLSAIPFWITKGNPLFVSWFLILLQSLSVIPIYMLGKRVFNARVGLISAVIFSVSFAAVVYARWLSNPPLSIFFVSLFFFFLHSFIKGRKASLLLTAIIFGLAAQVQFLNLIFLAVVSVIFFITYFRKFLENITLFIISIMLAGLMSLGNFVLFDLRHEFLISKKIVSLVSGETGFYSSYFQTIQDGVRMFIAFFTQAIAPGVTIGVVFILVLGGFFLQERLKEWRKNKDIFIFLLAWLFAPLIVLMLLRHSILEHYFLFSLPAMILFTAYVIDQVWIRKQILGIALLTLIVFINIASWIRNIPINENIFFQATQPQLKFSDQKAVIDEIYNKASREPFFFQSYTIPYWLQHGWQYLFSYYGKEKYGYEPTSDAEKLYVIVQDDPSNEKFQKDWLDNTVSKWGRLISTFRRGIITVYELQVE